MYGWRRFELRGNGRMTHEQALIIMVKNPLPGKVKTRLAADIGEVAALNVYKALLQRTAAIAGEIQADRLVFYSDTVDRSDVFLNEAFKKYVQCSGDLGVRMDYAFSIPFKNEYRRAVMIGADCFRLEPRHIRSAFEALDTHDFAIGPANDGGYYLIGMKKWNRWIFNDKPWSAENLLTHTLEDIKAHNASVLQLDYLSDIDTLADLETVPELYAQFAKSR